VERVHEIERRKYMGITFEMIEKAIQEYEKQREKELAEIITKYDFLVGSEELKGKLIEVLPKEAKIIYTPYIDDPTAVYAIKKFEVSSLFSEPYKSESEITGKVHGVKSIAAVLEATVIIPADTENGGEE
jgi:hypothetical protein